MQVHVCGKVKNKEQYNHYKAIGNNPEFGYNWWRWLPELKKQYLDSKYVWILTWLNFWVEFDNV